MIKFEKIILTGFGSFRDTTEFKLNRPGLNIIIGLNGAGKTTIPSAISWVLFGKALKETKDVSTWTHLRNKDYKGTKVELIFTDTHGRTLTLIRCKDYKAVTLDGGRGNGRLILWDGSTNLLKGDKRSNQAELNELLGFNYEVLTNSIIFGQRMKRLIEASGPDKKKVFEEAFNATFIKDAKDKASKDLDVLKLELAAQASQLDKKLSLYNLMSETYSKQVEERSRRDKEQKNKLKTLKEELEVLRNQQNPHDLDKEIEKGEKKLLKLKKREKEYQKSREAYNKSADKLVSLRNNSTQLLSTQKRLEDDCQHLIDSIAHYENDDHDKATCETCGQELKDIKKAKILKDLKKRLKDKESELYNLQTLVLDNAAKIEAETANKLAIEQASSTTINITKLNNSISRLEKSLKSLERDRFNQKMSREYIKSCLGRIKEVKETPLPKVDLTLRDKIKEIEPEIDNLKKVTTDLTKEVDGLTWLVNDLLGNKGLKAYIFESMLQKLNELLVYYEQFIGFRVSFEVDLESGNKDIYAICYRGDHIIFYEDLSGGQKQLVDTATAFAMYDLITKDKPTNLLFFDEPFESLSQDASEVVYDLINDKANDNRSIFLITHNVDLQSSSTKIIRMSLNKNGTTQLKTL